MSIYDNRLNPPHVPSEWAKQYYLDHLDPDDPHIMRWWTPVHDKAIWDNIEKHQWHWGSYIGKTLIAITPEADLEVWKKSDPICSRWVWYNALKNWAELRAERCGWTGVIRASLTKLCPLCGLNFREDSLPSPLVERLGIDQLDFCAPCLAGTIFNNGIETTSKEQIRSHLWKMTDLLQRIPPQDFGGGMHDIREMSTDERLAVLGELRRKPTVRRVKELFGSWFKALIDAKLLENDARRLSLGTQCLARDGHTCFSLGEKTIDDLLHGLGIPHEREPAYPVGNFRADFLVSGMFIEYFGLAGDAEYDAKSKEKRKLCETHGIKLIAILPRDLVSSKKLESMLLTGLGLTEDRTIEGL